MPTGIGGSGCVCGAVTGGVLALGYFFGRTLTKKTPLGSPEHMAQCVSFTGEVAENVAKIVLREMPEIMPA